MNHLAYCTYRTAGMEQCCIPGIHSALITSQEYWQYMPHVYQFSMLNSLIFECVNSCIYLHAHHCVILYKCCMMLILACPVSNISTFHLLSIFWGELNPSMIVIQCVAVAMGSPKNILYYRETFFGGVASSTAATI